VLTNGTEAGFDPRVITPVLERIAPELRAFVADNIFWRRARVDNGVFEEGGEHRNVWDTLDRRLYAGRKYPVITAVYKQPSIKLLMVAPDIAVLSLMCLQMLILSGFAVVYTFVDTARIL